MTLKLTHDTIEEILEHVKSQPANTEVLKDGFTPKWKVLKLEQNKFVWIEEGMVYADNTILHFDICRRVLEDWLSDETTIIEALNYYEFKVPEEDLWE